MIKTGIYGQGENDSTVLLTGTKMVAIPNIGDEITIDMGGYNFISGIILFIEHLLDKHGAEHSMAITLDTLASLELK